MSRGGLINDNGRLGALETTAESSFRAHRVAWHRLTTYFTEFFLHGVPLHWFIQLFRGLLQLFVTLNSHNSHFGGGQPERTLPHTACMGC
jgi:hypothetical protein